MSSANEPTAVGEAGAGLRTLKGNWGVFVALGLLLVVLALLAMGSVVITTLATAVVIGVLLVISGFGETIGALFAQAWGGFFTGLLSGVLSIVVGLLFLRAPAEAVLTLTLLVACLLLVGGFIKIGVMLRERIETGRWVLTGGAIDVVLGLLIWRQWPASALWVIGLYVGINLLLRGLNWIMLGMLVRELGKPKGA